MGQINSTINPNREESDVRTVQGQASASPTVPDTTAPREDSGVNAQSRARARRKSIRNSIVDFVHTRPSRNVEHGGARDAMESTKWWRGHRRRQTQSGDIPSSQITDRGAAAESSHSDVQEPNAPAVHSVPTETPDSNCIVSSKGKERATENTADDAPPASSPITTSRDVLSTTTPGSSSSSGSTPDTVSLPLSQVTNESGSSESASRTAPHRPSSQLAPQAAPTNNPLRRFPPAGTLVVVQGVVHTDSTPISTTSPGQIPPVSTTDTRQGQPEPPSTQQISLPASSERNAIKPSESQGASGSSHTVSEDVTTNVPRTEVPPEGPLSSSAPLNSGPEGNSQTRGSTGGPNGADVLGALLSIVSVATAATAASLLSIPNGSPMPPASPPVQTDMSASATSPTPLEGPSFPLIAQALASANPIAAALLAQRERAREERERNRVRSIWEGLRDRMSAGRRSRTTPGIDSQSLFSEIARAFSLGPQPDGLSLSARSASSERPSSEGARDDSYHGQSSQSNDPEEAAPGSFEHFLLDLQTDLRLALTRPNPVPDGASMEPSGQNLESVDVEELSNSSDARDTEIISSGHHNADDATYERVRSSSRPDDLEIAADTNVDHISNASLRSHESETNVGIATSNENQGPPTHDTSTRPTTSSDDAVRNNINWWRMYRFPPIRPIQSRQNDIGHRVLQSDGAPRSTASAISITIPETAEPSIPSDPVEGAGMLVPVIVVGLQAISSDTRRSPPEGLSPPPHAHDGLSESIRGTEEPGHGVSLDSAVPQRGRDSWPSRAARAFSRLGRRDSTTDEGHEVTDSDGGSRTFFIYVFGGHYPPDHMILSGSGSADDIGSFEALWELADFLGQVKPPVVTDEQIKNSGLELFKAKSLKELESNGCVANNCVDRCLICLDDYEPEDDLRLLSCKHTFHKLCVDQWLKTGRNNCPACRTEGVKTGASPFTTSQ